MDSAKKTPCSPNILVLVDCRGRRWSKFVRTVAVDKTRLTLYIADPSFKNLENRLPLILKVLLN